MRLKMRRSPAVYAVVGLAILLVFSGTYYLNMEKNERENNGSSQQNNESSSSENGNLILLASGEKHNIYTDNSTFEQVNNKGGTPYLQVEVAPRYNLSFSWQVARKILKNPVFYNGSSGDPYSFHDREDKNRTVSVYTSLFIISYRLKGYNASPRDIKDFLPNETIMNMSLKFVELYRDNITDYRVESIVYSRVWECNATTGKKVFLGYLKQYVTLRQYINGIPVKGFYGRISLVFGPGGVLIWYMDLSLPYTKVVRGGTARPVTSFLNDMAENGYAGFNERNLTLKRWYPAFMTYGRSSREVAFLGYVIVLAPVNDVEREIEIPICCIL